MVPKVGPMPEPRNSDMTMDGITVNPDDAYERDIVWRYTQMWKKLPRHLRTDQRWVDLVLFCRSEIDQHRAKLAKRPQ